MKHLFFALLLSITASLFAASSAFRAEVVGKGAPVIFIPGHSCNGEVWSSTVDHFKDRYECHVLSLAGFGGTPAIQGPFLAQEAEAIADYIREHHLQNPVLVGHSLGGSLTMIIAAAHPDLVGRVVIVDSLPFLGGLRNPSATAEQAKEEALNIDKALRAVDDATYSANIKSGMFTRAMVDSEEDHAKIVKWGLATDRDTASRAMVELYSLDLRPELPKIQCPVLVLGGAKLFVRYAGLPAAQGLYEGQYKNLKGVRVLVSDQANHFIMYDAPAWMFSEMDSFLSGKLATKS